MRWWWHLYFPGDMTSSNGSSTMFPTNIECCRISPCPSTSPSPRPCRACGQLSYHIVEVLYVTIIVAFIQHQAVRAGPSPCLSAVGVMRVSACLSEVRLRVSCCFCLTGCTRMFQRTTHPCYETYIGCGIDNESIYGFIIEKGSWSEH